MQAYFAGATRVEEGFPELQHEVRKRLVSYHYQTDSLDEFYYVTERDKYELIILDSGAFSAWSKGVVIDIDKYAEYILKWVDKVSYVVNLDVIPAKPGVVPSPEEIERSASKGYENYWYLLKKGVPKDKLIHVYHQHEDPKWLNKMVHEDKMEYIGLSPANDMTVKQKMKFLDSCMPYVTDSDGKAIVKFHGFAVTSYDLMKRYPWYSVDSSTWAVAGGRNAAFIPYKNKVTGEFDFTIAPRKTTFSQIGGAEEHIKNRQHKLGSDSESAELTEIYEYLEYIGISLGKQYFSRESKDYVVDKEKGERVCSNSFVKNMRWEDIPKESKGLLSVDQLQAIDLNHSDIVFNYKGDNFKWVEHITEPGLNNYWKQRQRLNAIFLNKFVDILDKQEPRAYVHGKEKKGLVY